MADDNTQATAKDRLEEIASDITEQVEAIQAQRQHLEATVIKSIPIDRPLEALRASVNDLHQVVAELSGETAVAAPAAAPAPAPAAPRPVPPMVGSNAPKPSDKPAIVPNDGSRSA